MVTFDLTDVLNKSGLTIKSKEIQELLYQLSTQSASYMSNVYNLRTGKVPSKGALLSDQGNEYVANFVSEVIINEQNNADIYLSNMYTDTVFQVLVATGYIPVAWLYKNEPACVKARMIGIRNVWDAIVSDYDGPMKRNATIYTMIRSFGMLTFRAVGHTKEHLNWFLIPSTEADMSFLTNWIAMNHIDNVTLIYQSKYPEYLVNENYDFLFKFDKVVNAYTGVSFHISSEFTKTIPTYPVKIGCDRMCFFTKISDPSSDYSIVSNRYLAKDIKRGEVVRETVSVPNNHTIALVTINGFSYFLDTANAAAAGISVVETEVQNLTGYKTYEVAVSGITEPATVFIDACEDFTGRTSSKKMISRTKSDLEVSDDDVTIHLVLNRPFIFFNTDKVKVYARRDEMSEEELIEGIQVVGDGYYYVERKATFGELTSTIPTPDNSCCCGAFNSQLGIYGKLLDGPGNPDPTKPRDNPYIIHFLKPPYASINTPKEPTPETRAILYGVNECGHIIITFDGYTDYKFFRVTFEERAMIATYKVAGNSHDIDIIPVIEDFFARNPAIKDEDTEEPGGDDDKGDGSGENGEQTGEDSGTTEPTNPPDIGEVEVTPDPGDWE